MTDREQESESSQPRKRIAVACNRCRKRKIRCSGDPGNGGPCSNCKNAGHEPCLFLRVSSTETPLKDQDFAYNLDASRAFQAHQTRPSAVSPLSSVSQQYSADLPAGDVMAYRQGSYPYGNKGYYAGVSGWTSTYPDDSVEYVNYPPYQMMNQDPVHMMQGYRGYSSSKSVYVDPESSGYSYGSLVHRPAVSDSPNFSLSGMADSLPSTSSTRVPSDRLLPQVTRTPTHSSYRTDGIPDQYSSKSTAPHTSSSNTVSDAYGLNSSFESPVPYTATGTVPSNISHRSASQSDTTSYQPSSSSSTSSATDMYNTNDQSLRSTDDSGTSVSYIYNSDRDSARRDSHSSGGANTLSNGHIYVPGSHHHHSHHHNHHHSQHAQGYVVSGPSASHGAVVEGATTAATRSGHNGNSHTHAESHRRSAGSLRGGG